MPDLSTKMANQIASLPHRESSRMPTFVLHIEQPVNVFFVCLIITSIHSKNAITGIFFNNIMSRVCCVSSLKPVLNKNSPYLFAKCILLILL